MAYYYDHHLLPGECLPNFAFDLGIGYAFDIFSEVKKFIEVAFLMNKRNETILNLIITVIFYLIKIRITNLSKNFSKK